MPSATLHPTDPHGLPIGHSFEDHLEAERVALEDERRALSSRLAARRWKLVRSVGLGLVLAGTIAIGWQQTRPEPTPKFCTAEGIVGGEELRRDPDQGCAWVDADGKKVTVDDDGLPVGS